MPFINSISIETDKTTPFPFRIPAIKFATNIELSDITIIIGKNGCGKSTLLEAIGLNLRLQLIDGPISFNKSFEAAQLIQPFLKIRFANKNCRRGFFFRAEDFSSYTYSVQIEEDKLFHEFQNLELKENIAAQMSESNNFKLRRMIKDYGDDLRALSQGEGSMKVLLTKIPNNDIVILDEPEAHLHPQKLNDLINFISNESTNNKTQFIISTHSPDIASMQNALLYEIQDDGIKRLIYQDTNHSKFE
jgi:predicted ATPase